MMPTDKLVIAMLGRCGAPGSFFPLTFPCWQPCSILPVPSQHLPEPHPRSCLGRRPSEARSLFAQSLALAECACFPDADSVPWLLWFHWLGTNASPSGCPSERRRVQICQMDALCSLGGAKAFLFFQIHHGWAAGHSLSVSTLPSQPSKPLLQSP